jgi:hypothetical protein
MVKTFFTIVFFYHDRHNHPNHRNLVLFTPLS